MKKPLIIFSIAAAIVVSIPFRPHVSTAQSNGNPGNFVSSVSITHAGAQTSVALDSVETRINASPGETISVAIQWGGDSGAMRLAAPNGGVIDGEGGAVQLSAPASSGSLNFTFQPGTSNGRYTVEISQGTRSETMEFWVGPEPPRGLPGPAVTFNNL